MNIRSSQPRRLSVNENFNHLTKDTSGEQPRPREFVTLGAGGVAHTAILIVIPVMGAVSNLYLGMDHFGHKGAVNYLQPLANVAGIASNIGGTVSLFTGLTSGQTGATLVGLGLLAMSGVTAATGMATAAANSYGPGNQV